MHRFVWRAGHPYKARLSICKLGYGTLYATVFRNPFTTSSLRLNEPGPKNPPKVRWYEQLWEGAIQRQRVVPENEMAGENSAETRLLKRKVADLEAELAELRGENSTMIEPLLQAFSKEDQDKVRKALKQAKLDQPGRSPTQYELKMVEDEMIKLLPEEQMEQLLFETRSLIIGGLSSLLELTPPQEKRIRSLNYWLRAAAIDYSDAESTKKLWQSYMRCREHLPPFTHLLPDQAWDILWASQDRVSTRGQERVLHLSILSKDMSQGGKELNLQQVIVLIESLLLEGRQADALDTWQGQQSLIAKDGVLPIEYRMLGIRLFASRGDPQKAQDIAFDVLANGGQDVSRALVPVMEAWIKSLADGAQNAWVLYLHLKTRMGSNIKPEHYDQITTAFLHAGRTDLALAVFKDLMLTGKDTRYESTELYRTSLGLVSKLQLHSINASELTKVSLTALTILPRKFQNKYFYGSWMKRLIGMGNPDAAAMVLELMYERGVKPDSKHLNGIMGAWLRTGTARDKGKAERMGWAMIQERLDVIRRRPGSGLANGAEHQDVPGVTIPLHVKRTVSPATIETFSLLLLHYERRGRLKYVQLLREYLPLAQIHPNAYFMNHLLYAELRRGEHRKSWDIYESMSYKVRPDLETFAALWDCEKAHLDRLSIHPSDRFPGPRTVFYRMNSWYVTLGAKPRKDVKQAFSKELYDQIIRCMCLAKDLEGTIVALYALRELFHFFPDHDTSRMIILQVASMGIGTPKNPGGRRTRLTGNTQTKANIARITKVFELVTEQRSNILQRRGTELDEGAIQEEQLYLLAEFLRVILQRVMPDEVELERNIEKSASEMGVGGIPIVEPNVSP